jgi:tartrate dehydratase beta subunit/fumarate hydratase class I family protein
VEELGPLTVAIDAKGNSLYRDIDDSAALKRAAILEKLAQRRADDN